MHVRLVLGVGLGRLNALASCWRGGELNEDGSVLKRMLCLSTTRRTKSVLATLVVRCLVSGGVRLELKEEWAGPRGFRRGAD